MRSSSKTPPDVDGILLGLLKDKPMHGYDLYKILRQPGGISLVWRINQSNLYAILERMENDGMLVSRQIVEKNSRPRKEFMATLKGLNYFMQWMRLPVQRSREMRQLFLAKLYFARRDSNELVNNLIDSQISLVEVWKSDFVSRMNSLQTDQDYERLVFQSRELQANAWLQLLELCKTELSVDS